MSPLRLRDRDCRAHILKRRLSYRMFWHSGTGTLSPLKKMPKLWIVSLKLLPPSPASGTSLGESKIPVVCLCITSRCQTCRSQKMSLMYCKALDSGGRHDHVEEEIDTTYLEAIIIIHLFIFKSGTPYDNTPKSATGLNYKFPLVILQWTESVGFLHWQPQPTLQIHYTAVYWIC